MPLAILTRAIGLLEYLCAYPTVGVPIKKTKLKNSIGAECDHFVDQPENPHLSILDTNDWASPRKKDDSSKLDLYYPPQK